MRIGLAGTGPWATLAYVPGLQGAGEVDFVGLWGRDSAKVERLALEHGVVGYSDFDTLLRDVDAVAFALPPDVQAGFAIRAALHGKHLLLEKPLAASMNDASRVLKAIEDAAVYSAVFLTDRFTARGRSWLADLSAQGGWEGGWCHMFGSLDQVGNPFADSPWRRVRGALWDVGPHAISTFTAVLGPVLGVSAVSGQRDLVHLTLTHSTGATSTCSMTLLAPPAAARHELYVWGTNGSAGMPARTTQEAVDALSTAADELAHAAMSGTPHPLDARFGAEIVYWLDRAESQLRGSCLQPAAPPESLAYTPSDPSSAGM